MRRFFYHYYRQYNCMSVHWKGSCHKVEEVICQVPTETKRNKRQPRLIIRGFANNVEIVNNTAVIT